MLAAYLAISLARRRQNNVPESNNMIFTLCVTSRSKA